MRFSRIGVVLAMAVASEAHAVRQTLGNFKIRAREHYEIHDVTYKGGESSFRGLSNTINAWWEVPYKYSFGLALSPVFSNLSSNESSPYGQEISLLTIGLEAKYFPEFIDLNFFTRSGVGYAHLEGETEIQNDGIAFYVGLGYEFEFKKFGLALEVAYRHVELNHDVQDGVFTPSIGFHFYDFL